MNTARRWCAIAGPGILLLAWLTQQFLFDRWNGDLARLTAAEARWDVYRTSHYLFNALQDRGGPIDDSQPVSATVRWQLRNLEVGLENLEALIPTETLRDSRAVVMEAEDGGFGGPNGAMDIRFKTLKIAIDRQRNGLQQWKSRAQTAFWTLYFVGAILSFIATTLKERLEKQKESLVQVVTSNGPSAPANTPLQPTAEKRGG